MEEGWAGRAGKFGHAAHYTLRCGRQLADGTRQTALVALVCNLEGGPAAALSQQQVETLWHEFGHALQSLLSRTQYQHVAGAPFPENIGSHTSCGCHRVS